MSPRQDDPADAPEPAMDVERCRQGVDEARHRQRIEVRLPPQAPDPQSPRLAIDPGLDPTDEPVAEQDRQDVVTPAALLLGDVDLPDVVEAVQVAQEVAVPNEGIERRQEDHPGIAATWPPGGLIAVSHPRL